jgi:hypothetical protein
MTSIHATCVRYGQDDDHVNYESGANIAGFVKVADAMLAQGSASHAISRDIPKATGQPWLPVVLSASLLLSPGHAGLPGATSRSLHPVTPPPLPTRTRRTR